MHCLPASTEAAGLWMLFNQAAPAFAFLTELLSRTIRQYVFV
jgi:shikimate 5-dehydrogenase